jgi:S-adenosyl methyltransferase
MVLSHAKALLTSSPEGKTDYLDADLRDTGRILSEARQTLDLTQPVAVMLIGVLHCIPDDDDPYGIVSRLMAAVPSGSYLVVGHPASDVEAAASATATSGLNSRLAAPVKFRSREEVARFLDGLSMLEPGLVQYPQWRPGPGVVTATPTSAWCAVARKD